MTRTCLTGLALIGLLACGGKPTPAARNADSRPAAQPASGTTKSHQRTATAQRDTAKHVNPLTGH